MTTLASRCAGAQTRKLVPPPAISAPIGRRRVLLVFAKTHMTAASAVRMGVAVILRLPEPRSAKREDGGGRRRISTYASCAEPGFQHIQRILRSFSVLRRLAFGYAAPAASG